jgi:DNA-binding CsgD family transcriptional regulator
MMGGGCQQAAEQSTTLLTPREREIRALVAQGSRNQEIAQHLGISPQTVKNHLANIFAKLGVNRRQLAAQIARQADLPPADSMPLPDRGTSPASDLSLDKYY